MEPIFIWQLVGVTVALLIVVLGTVCTATYFLNKAVDRK
jgi:hypothetical protein